jgi:ABC-type transport system involved in cytochrome c biogenesis permease subunit
MRKYLPWLLMGVFALWVASALRPPRQQNGFDTAEFGRLPVLLNGRLQPVDSVGRNCLRLISGRQSVAIGDPNAKQWQPPKRLSAIEWLMEVTMKPEVADRRKVFRVDHPELRGLLKLPAEGPFYCSANELEPHFDEIERQATRAGGIEAQARNSFEKAVLKLHYAINVYQRLKHSLRPADADDFKAELAEFHKAIAPGLAAVKRQQEGQDYNQPDLDRLVQMLHRYELTAKAAYPLLVPPVHPEVQRDAWANIGASLLASVESGQLHPAVSCYAAMATAYRQGRPEQFNQAVADYRQWLGQQFSPELQQGRRECLFNQWQPFWHSTYIYVLVFVLGCASWFGWFQVLNRSGYYLLVLAFLVHTAGVLFRMVLEGRPPVTNLYSSAVFVGWGAVLLGLILEHFYRQSIGLVMSSAIGFLTQVIAHNLALEGDTMEMLRAVLNTNFWLATHVVTITLGCSATFVAGFLAILYVVRGVFTRSLSEAIAKGLARMVYGVVCFATLFSFLGTVLGGIWADQAWGRFWGWDPKENGSLIIVLWNAIIIHARRSGLVRERGLMNLAIFGNVVTSFSWFGVNMLGVGLHAYGFMDKAFEWLALFVLSQLLLIGDGLLARTYWRSFQAQPSRTGAIVRAVALIANVQALLAGALFGYFWALLLTGVFLAGVAAADLLAGLATAPPTKATV